MKPSRFDLAGNHFDPAGNHIFIADPYRTDPQDPHGQPTSLAVGSALCLGRIPLNSQSGGWQVSNLGGRIGAIYPIQELQRDRYALAKENRDHVGRLILVARDSLPDNCDPTLCPYQNPAPRQGPALTPFTAAHQVMLDLAQFVRKPNDPKLVDADAQPLPSRTLLLTSDPNMFLLAASVREGVKLFFGSEGLTKYQRRFSALTTGSPEEALATVIRSDEFDVPKILEWMGIE